MDRQRGPERVSSVEKAENKIQAAVELRLRQGDQISDLLDSLQRGDETVQSVETKIEALLDEWQALYAQSIGVPTKELQSRIDDRFFG